MKKMIKFGNLQEADYTTKEAFNSLRTNIRFCGSDIDVIMLTSSLPNEGKTTTAVDLARAFADDAREIVIVDADLRKSVMIGQLKLETDGEVCGLSHYLSGQAEPEDIINKTNIKHLDIVLSGHATPNPTELLGSQRFFDLLDQLREKYDGVIIDSPPLGSVIDAAVIAPHCDGAILVIESNKVSYRFAQEVKQQLERTGCRILGVVLNKVEVENGGYYNRYYKGYYKKYYEK